MNKKHLFILCLLWATCIFANAEEIPNNEIWYTASEKLPEIITEYGSGLHTNAFNTSISSHGFSDGKGIIKFYVDVTSIGDYAFRGCKSLTSITIPNSVTSIGYYAFNSCSSLTSITIPNSVTSIDGSAFSECSNLPVEGNLRYADTFLVEAVDKALSTNTIKEGTKWIGAGAFYNCYGLTSITIPNTVTSIGYNAFCACM